MIKRRESTTQTLDPELARKIESFGSSAESGENPENQLDPSAKRDFKAIRVPFNEYEYRRLERVAQKTGRSKLNLIRWAVQQMEEKGL